MVWNETGLRSDHVSNSGQMVDYKLIVLVKKSHLPNGAGLIYNYAKADYPANHTKQGLEAVPVNARFTKSLAPNFAGPNGRNTYNERHSTYIDEPFATSTTDASWGRNLYNFTNPFTSNIDLSYIGVNEISAYNSDENQINKLVGVSYTTLGTYTYNSAGTKYLIRKVFKADTNGVFVTGDVGDADALIVQPNAVFLIKTETGSTSTEFVFGDGLKTFSNTAKFKADDNGTNASAAGARSARSVSGVNASQNYYQATLKVYDNTSDNFKANRIHLVAASGIEGGDVLNRVENIYPGFTSGFYSLQENNDGTVNTKNSKNKMLINAVDINNYRGKNIKLAFVPNAGSTSYTVKSELFVSGKKVEGTFDNPMAQFVLEDKVAGKILSIDSSLNYTFTQSTATSDRFIAYLVNAPAQATPASPTPQVSSPTTLTSKSFEEKGVIKVNLVSDDLGKTATIRVFDMAGNLVKVVEKASTDQLSEITVPTFGYYMVTIEGENGNVKSDKVLIK
ncbi:MAG: hypothetical protein C4K58_07825 [Flavobacteriaceae bacterium]|nr:MAG: hypothetical protein C4K58_07825 [Flavobacteriaceae bacterium]